MKRLLYIILYVVLAASASAQRLRVGEQSSGMVTLQFTHISYEKESERLTLKDKVTKLDMILTPKSISLKEVTVKPDPLRQRGDTLTHNLASFLGKGDVTLEDGLKRLPGAGYL